MKNLKPIALWLGTLIVVAAVLLYYEADLLWKVQQRNTFLTTALYFKQQMVVPGGMLSYVGGFFTQFFYYPWMGVLFLCAWWGLLMWLIQRAFQLPERWKVLTLIPVATLLIANMELGYWIYILKLRGYFFVATLGTTAATALLWAFRKLPPQLWMRVTFLVVATLVGYPLFGTYALAAIVVMGVWTWRLSADRTQNGLLTLTALLSVVAIPLIYYRFVYYETNLTYLYRTGLPVFTMREDYPTYYIPFYVLAASFLLLALTYRRWKEAPVKKAASRLSSLTPHLLPFCLLVAVVGCVYHFWYKDDNFHHELRMQRCVEHADWQGVIDEGKKQDSEPTRAIVMMHNLALSRMGRQCDEMYRFRKGSSKINTPLPVYMYHIAGRMMFYQYGLLNESHRICMEEGVEYGWNMETLQCMARCAILGKEKQTARKMLDILRQTLFYGEWADRMERLLNDQGQLANDVETGPVTHMLHYRDRLDSADGYVERFLMNTLATHDANDLYFQEQAVLGAMWTRNPDLFWPRFQHFIDINGDRPMPRIFQEAAWLFANMEGMEGLDEWVLEKGVKENLVSFMQTLQNKNLSSSQKRKYLYQSHGQTYYFEYFFLKDITYY